MRTPEEVLGLKKPATEETLQSIDSTLKRIEVIFHSKQNDQTAGIPASCIMCKAKEVLDGFRWDTRNIPCLSYDKEREEIVVHEDVLMHYIQLANPFQKVRKIRLGRFMD